MPVGGLIAAVAVPLLGDPRSGFLFLSALVFGGALVGVLVLRSGAEHELDAGDVEWTVRDRRLWLRVRRERPVRRAPRSRLWASSCCSCTMGSWLLDCVGGGRARCLRRSSLPRFGSGSAAGPTFSARGWRPLRLIGVAVTIMLVVVSVTALQDAWILVPALAVATALSMAWNGLSFTIAAEIGGRRSGAAIGIQQTALAAAGILVPVGFAAAVSATSWQTAFLLAAVFPLAGWRTLRPLVGH